MGHKIEIRERQIRYKRLSRLRPRRNKRGTSKTRQGKTEKTTASENISQRQN